MLLYGNSIAVVKYISVIFPTVKFILTFHKSTKNRHFHDSVLSMHPLELSLF